MLFDFLYLTEMTMFTNLFYRGFGGCSFNLKPMNGEIAYNNKCKCKRLMCNLLLPILSIGTPMAKLRDPHLDQRR